MHTCSLLESFLEREMGPFFCFLFNVVILQIPLTSQGEKNVQLYIKFS